MITHMGSPVRRLRPRAPGRILRLKTGRTGPHVGRDPAATQSATAATMDFLRAVLKP